MSNEISPEIKSEITKTPVATEKPALELIDIGDFMKVALRVALVTAVEAVPKSKKLLKLQLDLGPVLGSRQIVSGIAQFYTAETLVGKRIIVVANLKPAQLMGVESNGMLLAGSSEDGTTLAIIEPHESLPLGSTVR
jgi:methionyl-tRNA synthetase